MSLVSTSLPAACRAAFGGLPAVGAHGLGDATLLSGAALIALLDEFPREQIYAFTKGSGPTHIDQYRKVRHEAVSGAELLEAVPCGRLCLNIMRVDLADPAYHRLIDKLYEQLAELLPDFKPLRRQGTLPISSPQAHLLSR